VSKRLIVNADDFGLCAGVDRGITRAAAAGVVSSVSVLSERVSAAALARLREAAPAVGLGLHVDLTRDLVEFDERDAAARARAQFERFVELVGAPPDHADTHKQTHRDHAAALRAVAALGVPVRGPDRRTRRRLRRLRVPCADRFVGGVGRRAFWHCRRLEAVLRTLRAGVTELMCHPGEHDGLPAGLHYRAQRAGELCAFLAPGLRDRLRAHGVELVTWAAVLR
jgi:predicted glycoside hydrolase/deacetylase ChbG (UPF0249 family)